MLKIDVHNTESRVQAANIRDAHYHIMTALQH